MQPDTPPQSLFFQSSGKLMISGEYLVLAGANALAMPVSYGQTLHIESAPSKNICVEWKTIIQENQWLVFSFHGTGLHADESAMTASQETSVRFIQSILLAAKQINPSFLSEGRVWHVRSALDFKLDWGLGSSSSLISNIAWWAGVNPFDLFYQIASGSGYDIACARSKKPILYTYTGKNKYPLIKPVDFNPPFSDHMVFLYSGKKQDSARSIRDFNPAAVPDAIIAQISDLSEQMASSNHLKDFMEMMRLHENILGECLGMRPVQQKYFTDFSGVVKSLGAWGGDFLLAVADMDQKKIIRYFQDKGYDPVFTFEEMRFKNDHNK